MHRGHTWHTPDVMMFMMMETVNNAIKWPQMRKKVVYVSEPLRGESVGQTSSCLHSFYENNLIQEIKLEL